MNPLLIFQIVSLVVSLVVTVYSMITASKDQNSTTDNFENPTADEGKPLGMCVGLTRCKANTIYFKLNRTRKIKTGGK